MLAKWGWLVLVAALMLITVTTAAPRFNINGNNVTALGEVKNLTAEIVVAGSQDDPVLKLNISWIPPVNDKRVTSYSIAVTSIPEYGNETFCHEGSLFYMSQNVSQTSILLPENRFHDDAASELEIQQGCIYSVQAVANPRKNGFRNSSSIIVEVPECLAGRCNCNRAEDLLPVPMVTAICLQNGSISIGWKIEKNKFTSVQSFRIRFGEFKYTSTSGQNVYNKENIIVDYLTNDTNYFIWNPESWNEEMKIIVDVRDENGCFGREGSAYIKKIEMHHFHHRHMPIFIAIGFAFKIIVIIGIVCLIKHLRQRYKSKFTSLQQKQPSQVNAIFQNPKLEALLKHKNILYVQQDYEDDTCKEVKDEYEIEYKRLNIKRELGHGQFGKVYLANLSRVNMESVTTDPAADLEVAVKMSLAKLDAAREQLELRQDLLEEIGMMKLAGSHPHLVGLIGCCTMPGNPICLVLEYMSGGDLLGYLHQARDTAAAEARNSNYAASNLESPNSVITTCTNLSNYSNLTATSRVFFPGSIKPEDVNFSEGPISHQEMMRFALEIAKGMEHLEAKGIVHRDLAARNILMDDKLRLKISDFGLSRKGTYMIGGTGVRRLPIRWMPPEAIRRRAFTSKSDVWSYGLVLWEIASLGDFPYPRLGDDELLRHLLDEDGRPEPLGRAELREAQLMCWSSEPELRPNFCQLVRWIESRRDVVNKNNPTYQELLWESDDS